MTPKTVCQETLDAIAISIMMGWSKKDDAETMVEYILMDPHWRLASREEALKFLGDLLEHPKEIHSCDLDCPECKICQCCSIDGHDEGCSIGATEDER